MKTNMKKAAKEEYHISEKEGKKMMDKRPSQDDIFMAQAKLACTRSTCISRKVGAVIVKDGHILASGYNGAPSGVKHCIELGGCMRKIDHIPSGTRQEHCRAAHAEQNAIIQAAKLGCSIEGGTLYVNTFPCSICTRMILNTGIKRIVYDADYEDSVAKAMFEERPDIKIEKYQPKVLIHIEIEK